MPWSDRLVRPVELPNGHKLVTLEDAAIYFQRLPKAQRDKPLIADSMRIIMDVAEGRAPDLLAQSAVAHMVSGPISHLKRSKPDRPWLKRKKAASARS